MLRGTLSLFILCFALCAKPALAKEGFFIGVGIGGTVVAGEDLVDIPETGLVQGNSLACPNCIRTQYAQGLAALLRLGYNILGAAAIDITLPGHFDLSGDFEWQAHFQGGVSLHPIGIAKLAGGPQDLELWDPYVLIGGGFSYGSYVAGLREDEKGWFSADLVTALGLNVHVLKFMSVGVDLRMVVPFYQKWIFNFGDDVTFKAPSGTTSILFTPSALLTFHLN